ncbi:MAG: hypothetical protein LBR68_01700 [Lachnoclostridium sp.]|nr:hypothetical protein [Lachnoclostridium sp.]
MDGRLEDICDKFRAFGFDVQTVKRYDVKEIYDAVLKAKATPEKPHCIILDTIKGLGVSFAEEADFNHYMTFHHPDAEKAIDEIEKRYTEGTYPGGDFKWQI